MPVANNLLANWHQVVAWEGSLGWLTPHANIIVLTIHVFFGEESQWWFCNCKRHNITGDTCVPTKCAKQERPKVNLSSLTMDTKMACLELVACLEYGSLIKYNTSRLTQWKQKTNQRKNTTPAEATFPMKFSGCIVYFTNSLCLTTKYDDQ